ncbi:MAG: hypothetical protein O2992_09600, partial [Gemmatimonadetes bacterium]|nr:hypothetical protein [Gemmatimonadota bacterium]
MPHPGHTYGLLNRPPLGSSGGLPSSLLDAAEESRRLDSPLGRQYRAQQAAMSGDPRYPAISATPSIRKRILDNVR